LLKVQVVVETLISDKNPLLKEVRRLASGGAPGAGSMDTRLVLAEGPHLLDEALRSGIEIHAVILAESAGEIPGMGARWEAIRVVRVLDGLFNKLASTESPQGVLALVRLPEWTAEDLLKGTPLVVVLDGVQDPGNAGAILRTAEAFGATGAVFLKGTVSPSNPKCLRASAGSAFRVPVVSEIPTGLALFAADPRGALSVADARLAAPCAIVIGGEGSGVRPELAARATGVKIPTTGVESLNAAVAAGILLYEARTKRAARETR
jgi:RNA methyltransferase, TrmH family